jgi:ribonuclease HII
MAAPATCPDLSFEQQQNGVVCGVDEAGRGPWAGSVIAAAVIWPAQLAVPASLNDSKKLSRFQRELLFDIITTQTQWGIGEASVEEIDQLNILGATKLAMQRAVAALPVTPDFALIDGNQPPQLPCHTLAIIKGDSKSVSIAAASILAKVTRDRIMEQLAQHHPQYGFERHAGYGTKQHQEALAAHGICHAHRRSFAPIRALLNTKAAS